MRSVFICAIVSVVAFATAAAPVAADEVSSKQLAQELVNDGYDLARGGDHLGALSKFTEAYELYQSPNLHIYIGTALWNLGRYAEARSSYVAYLEHDDSVDAKREQVRGFLTEIDQQVSVLIVSVTPLGAAVVVDGVAIGSDAVYLDPGRHTVVATKTGFVTKTKALDLHAGKSSHLELALERRQTRRAVKPPSTTSLADVEASNLGPPRGRLGGAIGVVIDPAGPGVAALVGGSYAVVSRVELVVAGIAGAEQGLYLGGRLFLSDARLRPSLAAGAPVFASDDLAYGLRGALGVEWLVSGSLSIMAELGVEHYPGVPSDRVSTLFAPAIGIVARN